VSRQVTRLEETLNNPRVVLVVGAVAVALNVLLYFGVFLPRMTPLFGHVYAIGTSIPEAIAKLGPEANGKVDSEAISKKSVAQARSHPEEAISKKSVPEASGKVDSKAISKKSVPEARSHPEAAISKSVPQASAKHRLGASGKSVTEGSLGSVSYSPQDPPSGTPPNSPQDTPSGTPPVSPPPQASVPPQSSAPPQFPSGSPPQSSSPSTQQYR
jgi:hypothetical protein